MDSKVTLFSAVQTKTDVVVQIGALSTYAMPVGDLKGGYTPAIGDVFIYDTGDTKFDKYDAAALGTQIIEGIVYEYDAALESMTIMKSGIVMLGKLGVTNLAANMRLAEMELSKVGIISR